MDRTTKMSGALMPVMSGALPSERPISSSSFLLRSDSSTSLPPSSNMFGSDAISVGRTGSDTALRIRVINADLSSVSSSCDTVYSAVDTRIDSSSLRLKRCPRGSVEQLHHDERQQEASIFKRMSKDFDNRRNAPIRLSSNMDMDLSGPLLQTVRRKSKQEQLRNSQANRFFVPTPDKNVDNEQQDSTKTYTTCPEGRRKSFLKRLDDRRDSLITLIVEWIRRRSSSKEKKREAEAVEEEEIESSSGSDLWAPQSSARQPQFPYLNFSFAQPTTNLVPQSPLLAHKTQSESQLRPLTRQDSPQIRRRFTDSDTDPRRAEKLYVLRRMLERSIPPTSRGYYDDYSGSVPLRPGDMAFAESCIDDDFESIITGSSQSQTQFSDDEGQDAVPLLRNTKSRYSCVISPVSTDRTSMRGSIVRSLDTTHEERTASPCSESASRKIAISPTESKVSPSLVASEQRSAAENALHNGKQSVRSVPLSRVPSQAAQSTASSGAADADPELEKLVMGLNFHSWDSIGDSLAVSNLFNAPEPQQSFGSIGTMFASSNAAPAPTSRPSSKHRRSSAVDLSNQAPILPRSAGSSIPSSRMRPGSRSSSGSIRTTGKSASGTLPTSPQLARIPSMESLRIDWTNVNPFASFLDTTISPEEQEASPTLICPPEIPVRRRPVPLSARKYSSASSIAAPSTLPANASNATSVHEANTPMPRWKGVTGRTWERYRSRTSVDSAHTKTETASPAPVEGAELKEKVREMDGSNESVDKAVKAKTGAANKKEGEERHRLSGMRRAGAVVRRGLRIDSMADGDEEERKMKRWGRVYP